MGAQAHFLLQAPTHFISTSLNPHGTTKFSNNFIRRCSTRSRSKWNPNADPTSTGRFRFNLEDELYSDGSDDTGDFHANQRVWWSDDDYGFDNDWEVDEEDEFSIFKIFRAFGWMLPAIAVSFLLGTGSNAFFMALAVPLGQSVLSLLFDKVWGKTINSPKSRSRTKSRRKPFTRPASNTKTSQSTQENEAAKGRGSYQSWVVQDGDSSEKAGKRNTRFGGWDELDKKIGNNRSAKKPRSQVKNELPKQQRKGKMSRISRIKETPLLLRLLIAIFPFLGSWTKLLF